MIKVTCNVAQSEIRGFIDLQATSVMQHEYHEMVSQIKVKGIINSSRQCHVLGGLRLQALLSFLGDKGHEKGHLRKGRGHWACWEGAVQSSSASSKIRTHSAQKVWKSSKTDNQSSHFYAFFQKTVLLQQPNIIWLFLCFLHYKAKNIPFYTINQNLLNRWCKSTIIRGRRTFYKLLKQMALARELKTRSTEA